MSLASENHGGCFASSSTIHWCRPDFKLLSISDGGSVGVNAIAGVCVSNGVSVCIKASSTWVIGIQIAQ